MMNSSRMAAKIRMPSICFSLTAITEFPRDEVTQRFPDGLTVWQAEGQWQTAAGSIDREQSKVLLLVHGDTAAVRQSVQAVILAYRKTFDQQSVLWESARVCVAT